MAVPDVVFPVPIYDYNREHLARHAHEPIVRDWFADVDFPSAVNAAIEATHQRNLVIAYDCLRSPTATSTVPTRLYLLAGGVKLFLVWRSGEWHLVTAFSFTRHPNDAVRFDQLIRHDVQPLATANAHGLIPAGNQHTSRNGQHWCNIEFDLRWDALEEWGYRRVVRPRFRLDP